MVSHQTKGVDLASELLSGVLEDKIKPVPVAVVKKDRISGIATENDVVNGAGKMDAGFTSHGNRVVENIRKSSLTP
jgi:hypothetical protein